MVEILKTWHEGVTLMEKGNFQDALMNFIALEGRTDSSQTLITSGRNLFNIGQTYRALGNLDRAAKAFEESVDKDKMLAVGHFMLGNVSLALNRNEDALESFNNANFYLRGNKLINYQQLGLKYKLYLCEILANRAISHARLGHIQEARDDFLNALQSKVEARHCIIEDSLLCWQAGENVEPLQVPSHAVFQPPRKQVEAIKDNPNFLGKSKVVAAHEPSKFPETRTKPPASPSSPRKVEDEQPMEEQSPTADGKATGRRALMTALRDGNTRKSLKRVSTPPEPPNKPVPTPLEPPNRPLPVLPERPSSPRRPPPSPRSQHKLRESPVPGSESRSPLTRRRIVSAPPGSPVTEKRSSVGLTPPDKPLPPAPKKSPLPRRKISEPVQFRKGRDATVTVQLVLTRSIKVDEAASTQDLVRAAANTFRLSEDSFALWCMRNGQLSALQDKDLEGILNSPANNMETIYCYENKPQ